MKKFLYCCAIVIFLIATTFMVSLFADPSPIRPDEYGARDVTNLTARIAAIGDREIEMDIDGGEWGIYNNLTIPTNVTLKVYPGSYFQISAGATLTINGPLKAERHRIFYGPGNAAGSAKFPYRHLEWGDTNQYDIGVGDIQGDLVVNSINSSTGAISTLSVENLYLGVDGTRFWPERVNQTIILYTNETCDEINAKINGLSKWMDGCTYSIRPQVGTFTNLHGGSEHTIRIYGFWGAGAINFHSLGQVYTNGWTLERYFGTNHHTVFDFTANTNNPTDLEFNCIGVSDCTVPVNLRYIKVIGVSSNINSAIIRPIRMNDFSMANCMTLQTDAAANSPYGVWSHNIRNGAIRGLMSSGGSVGMRLDKTQLEVFDCRTTNPVPTYRGVSVLSQGYVSFYTNVPNTYTGLTGFSSVQPHCITNYMPYSW